MSRLQANLLLLLAGATWGVGFVAQSTAMDAMGPLWFIGLRFIIATLIAIPFVVYEARRATAPLPWSDIGSFVLTGLALLGAAVSQQIGLLTTSVTNSGFLTGLYVVFVPVFGVLVLKRRPHWIIWPACLLCFIGIFLMSGAGFAGLTTGDLLTVLCAAFWAVQIIMVGIVGTRSGRPMALCLVQFLLCAVAGCGLGAIAEPISLVAITEALPEILFAGTFSSGLAFIFQNIGQRYTTAPQAAIFMSSEVVFAAAFGTMLLGETIAPIGYLGCAILFAAMLMVEIVPEIEQSRRAAKAPAPTARSTR